MVRIDNLVTECAVFENLADETMDETYQYPPELFHLLVDTIPLLCRSKTDVLLFFKGAGVNASIMSDLQDKVSRDKNSIYKHEIARTILSRLNERGDRSLRERREISMITKFSWIPPFQLAA